MNISAIIQLSIAGIALLYLLLRYLIPAIYRDIRGTSSIVEPDTPYNTLGAFLIIFFGVCEACHLGYWGYVHFQQGKSGWGLFYIFLLITTLLAIILLLQRKQTGAIIALAHVAYVFSLSMCNVIFNMGNLIHSFGLYIGLYVFQWLATAFLSYIMGRYIYSGYDFLDSDAFSEKWFGYFDTSRRIIIMMVFVSIFSFAIPLFNFFFL